MRRNNVCSAQVVLEVLGIAAQTTFTVVLFTQHASVPIGPSTYPSSDPTFLCSAVQVITRNITVLRTKLRAKTSPTAISSSSPMPSEIPTNRCSNIRALRLRARLRIPRRAHCRLSPAVGQLRANLDGIRNSLRHSPSSRARSDHRPQPLYPPMQFRHLHF